MLETITTIIVIQIICVIIIDLSGFTESLLTAISYFLTQGKITKTDYSIKPFTCSLCMTWWLSLIYLVITHNLSLLLILTALLAAYLTPITKDILILISDLAAKLNRVIYNLLKLNE